MNQKRDGLYYLNNTGTRWVIIENGRNARRTFKVKFGGTVTRAVKHFDQAGNFVTCNVWWRGRRINVCEYVMPWEGKTHGIS